MSQESVIDMRRWVAPSILLFSGSWGLLYLFPPSMDVSPPTFSPDPTVLSDPLRYTWIVSILLVISVGCYLVTLPGEFRPRQDTTAGGWGIVGFLGWFGTSVGTGLVVLGMVEHWTDRFLYSMLISNTTIQVVFLGGGVSFLWFQNKLSRFSLRRIVTSVWRGIVEYGRLFPFIAIAAWLNTRLIEWLGFQPGLPQSLLLFGGATSPLDWLMLAILIVVLAPVCEELFFRGVFYNLCREWVSPVSSALLSSLVFTSVHQEPSWFLPVFVLGYGLARAYERSGSLGVSITIHAVQNGLSFTLLYVLLS